MPTPSPPTTSGATGRIEAQIELFDEGIYVQTERTHRACGLAINSGFVSQSYYAWAAELEAGERTTFHHTDFSKQGKIGETYDPSTTELISLSISCDTGRSYGFWRFQPIMP